MSNGAPSAGLVHAGWRVHRHAGTSYWSSTARLSGGLRRPGQGRLRVTDGLAQRQRP